MFDERAIEMGAMVEAEERDRAIARAQAALTGDGSDECQDCGADIPEARRAALPSATRCVRCQSIYERHGAARHA